MVPVLTLEGPEGKLYRPMALTLIFALGGALLIALTLTPALCYWLLPRGGSRQREGFVTRVLQRAYGAALERALRWKRAVLVGSCAMVILAGALGSACNIHIGSGVEAKEGWSRTYTVKPGAALAK